MSKIPLAGRLSLLALSAALTLAACRSALTTPPPNPVDGVWELRALVEGGDSLSAPDDLAADLLRFEADGGVRVRSCNFCSGLYEYSGAHVVVQRLACTRRACEAGRLELDRYVAGRAAYHRRGDWLVLDVDDEVNRIEARLYFAPVPPGVWDEE